MPLLVNSGVILRNVTVSHRSRYCGRNIGMFGYARLSDAGFPCRGKMVSISTDRVVGAEAATILVVEDDRAVRLLFTKVLQRAGYDVIACENGTLGFETARNQIGKIDAIVTDARMPGMHGPRLIARIRALRPEIPAILVSGNLADAETDASTVFLSKPVSPGVLTRELRRLLCARM